MKVSRKDGEKFGGSLLEFSLVSSGFPLHILLNNLRQKLQRGNKYEKMLK